MLILLCVTWLITDDKKENKTFQLCKGKATKLSTKVKLKVKHKMITLSSNHFKRM